MKSDRLLVIVTGSSAAMILSAYLSDLKAELGLEMTVLMTKSAERFVRPEVVGWFADEVLTCDTPGVNPVQLALSSRAIVVLPASANTLAAVALGLMPTPATTALAAAPSPCLYFPHMNGVLWRRPIMQQHVETLRARGDTIVAPLESEVYEIWQGTREVGPCMPATDEVPAIIRDWLSGGTAASGASAALPASADRRP